ncbi:hypothetical protein ACTJJ0_29780 [Chitinophaga sp. 22321]|uniref:Uncharacterized protein n=1 Tax=Chitinophaga hostae TaxID=2831022 RepID=A0ABS5J7J8_9BACT|nr:hypothetical protein [Chitinophaga hostae]MBS0031189.1 hypothetical protein [Chitinophaga hostae]
MKYHNPVAVLERMNGKAIDPTDTAAVALLRKKMLAELELTADKVLQVAGEWWSKNDLLVFFDRLQSPAELHFHQEINNDPVLSQFLETGTMAGLFADKALYKDNSFLSFIAPFYEPLFTAAVLTGLQQRQVTVLQYLFGNPLLIPGEQVKRSYDKIFRFLGEQYTALENLRLVMERDRRTFLWKEEAGPYVSYTQVKLLNALPDVFMEWRSSYGILMINVALVLSSIGERKIALGILEDVQRLKSTAHVQENATHFISYVKEAMKTGIEIFGEHNTPFDKLLARWNLSRDGLLRIAVAIFIMVVIGIGSRYEKERHPAELYYSTADQSPFGGSRTYWTMQYLLSQLESNTVDRAVTIKGHTGTVIPKTGDDLYGPQLMAALGEQGDVGKFFTEPRYDAGRPVLKEDSTFTDPQHRQSLCVFNRVEAGLITIIQTPDSFYSRYVSAHDSVFVPLPLALSQVYFYLGLYWSPEWSAAAAMKYVPDYRAKGFFLLPYFNSVSFLRQSRMQFVLDSNYWKTSNRYMPVEISLSGAQQLQLKRLSDNVNGTDIKIGE